MKRKADTRGSSKLLCRNETKILKQERWLPDIITGRWTLKYEERFRKGPGLNYPGEVTAEAGTEAMILEVRCLSVSVWGRTQDGWLCLYMSGTWYVE